MVAPQRMPLAGLVEADESLIACRSKDDPPSGGGGRSHQVKLLVAGAAEVGEADPREADRGLLRQRPARLPGRQPRHRRRGQNRRRVRRHTRPTRRWKHGRPCLVLPWVYRVLASLRTWALGVYSGLRRQHLQSYLDEFVFRYNRRRSRLAAFRSILGISVAIKPATCNMLIAPELQG